MGFWGINTLEEYGSANLGAVMSALIFMELGRTLVPFMFAGSADNILYYGNERQKEEYLIPTIEGERKSCFALTEPGAGSDPSAIRTTDVKDGNHWVINGQKVFITGGNEADFAMVFAVTDRSKPPQNGGVTYFLVDREMCRRWVDDLQQNCSSRMCECLKITSLERSGKAFRWACSGSARDGG